VREYSPDESRIRHGRVKNRYPTGDRRWAGARTRLLHGR